MVGCVISDIVRAPGVLVCQLKLQMFTFRWRVRSLAIEDMQEREESSVEVVGCVQRRGDHEKFATKNCLEFGGTSGGTSCMDLLMKHVRVFTITSMPEK